MWIESHSEGNEQPSVAKKALDLSRLIADSHLTKEEKRIISESYDTDKQALLDATKWEIRNFILKDYGSANAQYLGGMDGVIALQKKLWVEPADGQFWPDTFKALIEYQKANGLETDAIAGPKTQTKLGISSAIQVPSKDSSRKDVPKTKSQVKDRNTLGGIIVDVPVSNSESVKPVDNGKVLWRYEIRLRWIQESLADIRKHRDENTGFFNVLGDDIVGAFWGSTWKQAYESSYENTKTLAKDAILKLDADMNGKYLSDGDRSQYLRIRGELEKCLGQKLGEPNPFVTMKNSLMDTPNSAKNAVIWTAGVVVWTAETAWWAIKWVFDLTIFLNHYAYSYIGQYVWIEPEYKNKMDAEMSKVWTAIKGMNFTKEQVFDAIGKWFDQIKDDPYAIGKLSGIVIGILLPIKWAGALNNVVRGKKATAEAAEVAVATATRLGKPAEMATAKLAAEAASKHAKIWKMGEFILNGPAEGLIGVGLSKSFSFIANTLRWGASTAHKLKTIENGIKEFEEAIGNETHRPWIESPRLKSLREAKEALEAEKNNLLKETKKTTETPKTDSVWEKKFITEWKSDKHIYKELQQYYNPTRPNLNHPKAEEIAKELSAIKERMKQWSNVRSDLEALAKDPDAYLAKKTAEQVKRTPHEEFVENLKRYEQQFSESHLKSLAESDATKFGEALLHKRTLEEISTLAKTDPARAMTEFNAFMNSPNQYLSKKFPWPYITVSSEIRDHARWAYESKFKAEWEKLMASRKQAYEEYLSAHPDTVIKTEAFVSEMKKFADSLRWTFDNLAKELDRILALMAGNARANTKMLGEMLDSFMEKVRLSPNMTMDVKAKIANNVRGMRERFFGNKANPIEWIPEYHYQNLANEKGIPGINIPRSNGTISGVAAWDFRIIWEKGSEDLRIYWKEGDKWMQKNIPRKQFEELNPEFASGKSAPGKRASEQAPTQETTWNKEMPRRNTSFKEWNEVPRAREVISVWDLHGSRRAFELNLKHSGVIDGSGKWIGGNREIVFHGDILADRNTGSFEIFQRIEELQVQARREGGNISVLSGNHEDFAFAYLTWEKIPSSWRWREHSDYTWGHWMEWDQASGLREFKRFGRNWAEALENMRKNPEGRRILESMCNMKLAEQIDDTLFLHVVPNEQILSAISEIGIDEVNRIYQQGMRAHLLGEWNVPNLFQDLRGSFLDTESRSIANNPRLYQTIKGKWINHIVHGHNSDGGAHHHVGWVEITSNDFGFEKSAGKNSESPSTIKIQRDGNFQYGRGDSMDRREYKKAA